MRVFKRIVAVLKRSVGFILLLSVSGTSVALATLTFTGTSLTTDNFVGLLGGLVGVGATTTGATFYVQSQGVTTTTLQLQGLAGQTARLFAVASSSGVNTFEILASGVASSSAAFLINGPAFAVAPVTTSTSLAFLQGSVVGSTTLNIVGFTNQTANLLTLSSSTGVNVLTVGPTGVASSTEFRSPSSTIDTLIATNVSSTNFAAINASTTNVSSTRVTVGTSLMLGGGTAMTKMVCNSTSSKISSTATTATSTVGIEVTGLSTSTNQAYWWNLASTSPGFADFQLMSIQVSSTISTAVPRADLFFKNWSLATFAPTGNVTTTLCYTQF